MNIVGNIVCGQVTGNTPKELSERFGKINQQKESVSITSSDTSVSRSTQLDYAIPASKIASLSSGEFVGMVADDPRTISASKLSIVKSKMTTKPSFGKKQVIGNTVRAKETSIPIKC